MPDEAESLFQLMYLLFSKPCLDSLTLSSIRNQVMESNRVDAISDSVRMLRTGYSPRTLVQDKSYFLKATPERIIKVWKECFGCPDLFTFVITGNLEEKEALRLCRNYLASLPKTKHRKDIVNDWRDVGIKSIKGVHSRKVCVPGEETLASVVVTYNYNCSNYIKDAICCDIVSQAFQTRCMEELREKDGAVYAVTIHNENTTIPTPQCEITAELSCSTYDVENIKSRIFEMWDYMSKNGLSDEEFLRVKKFLNRKTLNANDSANKWADCLTDSILSNEEMQSPSIYLSMLTSLTITEVNDFVRRFHSSRNRLDVVFLSH